MKRLLFLVGCLAVAVSAHGAATDPDTVPIWQRNAAGTAWVQKYLKAPGQFDTWAEFVVLIAGYDNVVLAATDGAVDFSATAPYRPLSISADTTFTGSNYAVGKQQVYIVTSDGTPRNLAFPVDWIFIGTKPTNIAANKTGVLSLLSVTTAATGVLAAWRVQE